MRRRHRPLPPLVLSEGPRLAAKLRERKLAAEREMWAYECLPSTLRQAVRDSALQPCAQVLLGEMERLVMTTGLPRGQIAQIMAIEMPATEERELRRTDQALRAQHGVGLPHVAAGASVLRPR